MTETVDQLPILSLRKVSKGWYADGRRISVLKGITLDIYTGQSLAVVGPSGAGKSTLLHILGLLTPADEGEIWFKQRPISSTRWWDNDLRRESSMIFQDAKLIPNLSVMENVCVPLNHRGIWLNRQKQIASQALEAVGLGHRIGHKPNQLSGGEMMRAAIARSLVTGPRLILADEPTGTLDTKTGEAVADLLFETVAPQRSLVLVTHHIPMAERADRVIRIIDGQIENDSRK